MSARARALARLMEVWDGQVEPLSNLETVIGERESAVTDATLEALGAAARLDLGDVPQALAAFPMLRPEDLRRLSAKLGWTVRALRDLRLQADKHELRLEAALLSASFWDEAGSFWEAVCSQFDDQPWIAALLREVVRSRVPETRIPSDTPVWEREHLQALRQAERKRSVSGRRRQAA